MAHANLSTCHSIADLRALAQRRLPHSIFHYLDGAAESELTARRNVQAFDQTALVPRALVDVSGVNTSIEVLGQRIGWPLICAPTGASRLYHADGELAVARAAAHAQVLYSLSVAATHTLERIAHETPGPKLFQLLLFKDRARTFELMERCRASGYGALCLTIDASVRGKRERELRFGMGVPPQLSLRSLAYLGMRPQWCWKQLAGGALTLENVAPPGLRGLRASSQCLAAQLDLSGTWKDVEDLVGRWRGPFALKGILSAHDARRAAESGVTCLVVSNHGGRQLDGAVTPFDVLEDIAAAVRDRLEIVLDGGIRRGTQILKALARGAHACMIGRAYLYGLGAGGEAGVTRALAILHDEFLRALQLCGCTDVQRIDSRLLAAVESRGATR